MAVENAPGYPAYSGTFVPEVWSTTLLVKFYASTVWGEIANTDYEGDIKNVGDKVNIRQTPDVTISDYTKGSTISPENLEAAVVEFPIDKAKYFYFSIDSIDKYQSDIDLLGDWGEDAAQQMKIAIDTDLLGTVYSQTHASNAGATAGVKTSGFNLGTTAAPVTLTKSNVLDYLMDLGTVLDEQNVPEDNRWVVIPPWFAGLIKKSELKDASVSGDGTSMMRNGRLGMIDRFTLYSSNLLAVVTNTTQVIAGHKKAISFASQITEMEYFEKLERTFGKALRGLNVYGYKVTKSEALALLVCQKG